MSSTVSGFAKGLAIGAAASLLATGIASRTYSLIRAAQDKRRFPPPGQLVDIGGRRLHVIKAGQGDPAVLVLSSLGATSLEWIWVQRELSGCAVYLVDRGGLGWSDPVFGRRTPSALSDELDRLITALRLDSPVVLVGHSYGGLAAQLFAARNRHKVAGLVLMDSSHGDQAQKLRGLYPEEKVLGNKCRKALGWATKLHGLKRAKAELGLGPHKRVYAEKYAPKEFADAYAALEYIDEARSTVAREWLGMEYGVAAVRNEVTDLGDLPITVVTGGATDRETWHPGWVELQDSLMNLSTRSTRVWALHTGHHVNSDDPKLVAGAIQEVVEQARAAAVK